MTNQQQNTAELIAEALLRIEAVVLRPDDPFTWTSGIKAPIYCDNRMTISYPDIRELIADSFVELIQQLYPDTEVIAGAATGGIPHAAWVAQKLKLPMIYVRDKAKGHGKENLIEGKLNAGQRTVVIEDLFSTGGSSIKVAQAVNDAGGVTLGVAAIFSYQLDKATQGFANSGFPYHSLSNYETLLKVAASKGIIQEQQLKLLQSWRHSPETYGIK
ncbi:MAG: orotate phosphoribosyltransferase [Paenibacillaceae bacterium]